MSRPLISIVIATKNAAALLPKCLESVRAQTLREVEVLIADGASSDDTLKVVEAYRDIVSYCDSEPDSGPYAARNRVLPKAKGEWICFLGADDWLWEPRSLEDMAPRLREALGRYRVAYGRCRLIDADGRLVEEAGEPWESFRGRFRSRSCLPHQGVMHHRSLFQVHGLFDESFRIVGDYELLLRELKSADALYVPLVVAAMGFGGQATDLRFAPVVLTETRRALRMHGFEPPRLEWAYLIFTARCYVLLHRLIGDRAARRVADAYRLLTLRGPRYTLKG